MEILDAVTDVPLMYTSRGNVPIDTLEMRVFWDITDKYIKVRECFYDKTSGELVRESAHAYDKHGVSATGATASF